MLTFLIKSIAKVKSNGELSNGQFQNYYIEETLNILNEFRCSCFYVEKDRYDFVEILEICSLNLEELWKIKDYNSMKCEVYINHNVQFLILGKKNIDVIHYYIESECFSRSISKYTCVPLKNLQRYYVKWVYLYEKYDCHKMRRNYRRIKKRNP